MESDVGTLETKVDQHTQSISGLSTDVNGLKTSKQDKLIAGSGITIGSDGKTISSAGPSYRTITGTTEIFNEFLDYLNRADVGETFYVYTKRITDNKSYFGTVDSAFCRLEKTGSQYYIELYPSGPFEYITELTEGSYVRRFFRFFGGVKQTQSSSVNPTVNRSGWIEMTYSRPLSGGEVELKIQSHTPQTNSMNNWLFSAQSGNLVSKMDSIYAYYAQLNYGPKS